MYGRLLKNETHKEPNDLELDSLRPLSILQLADLFDRNRDEELFKHFQGMLIDIMMNEEIIDIYREFQFISAPTNRLGDLKLQMKLLVKGATDLLYNNSFGGEKISI